MLLSTNHFSFEIFAWTSSDS